MNYLIQVNDEPEVGVHLSPRDREVWAAQIDGARTVELRLRGRTPDGGFIVDVDGVERIFHFDQGIGSITVDADGAAHQVAVQPLSELVLQGLGAAPPRAARQAQHVKAPITGIVVEVMAAEGDTVRKGQPLVVIEAMKMENTLTAPCDGVVRVVHAGAGQTVFVDEDLLEID